jgi:tRNA U34 5-methylaminomethyl-2-thiouridine-forming methyltransferase MnmC
MYIITTKDGSHSLFSEEYDEIYHSGNGAIQESQHVFMNSGFDYGVNFFLSPSRDENKLKIFEVGFGTGLNALLTIIASQKQGVSVYYETIEKYPVPLDVIKELNYTQLLENEKYRPPFHSMHLSTWNNEHAITPNFSFEKNHESLLNFQPAQQAFHVIYFDAFAPENQPEMWTVEVMKKLYQSLQPNGILVSYCSKSAFRKTLLEAGFEVEKLQGPPGKREMVRAHKRTV